MKAHNRIDDMFQQHFAESAIPMNNQEELWNRISGKKDDKNRGLLWLSLLGLVFCVVAGFGLINLNNNTTQNLENNIVTNAEVNNLPNRNKINPIILAESENNDVENREATKNKTAETLKENSRLNFGNNNEIKKEEIVVINNINQVVGIAENHRTDEWMPEVSLFEDGDRKSEEINKRNTLISDLDLIDIETESINLWNNTPPPYNQSDSWSKCEVKTPGHFFVDVYGQAGLPMDKIDFSQVGSDQTAYRDLFDIRFDPKASWHGGAQIGYEFQNGLRVSAGAEYQEIVTQYSDNQRITETIRVWDPQAFFIIDANGDRVAVGDTVTAINIYDRKFVRKNTHTLLHIPFQVSYDIYKKPSFHVAVDASAALNLSKTYEGQFIRSDQTLIMIDENNQDNYISKDIGVSFSAGLHLGYYMNDNWEVYASPRFRYNPNSYLVDTETLKITRNMIGLRGGLRYHF